MAADEIRMAAPAQIPRRLLASEQAAQRKTLWGLGRGVPAYLQAS